MGVILKNWYVSWQQPDGYTPPEIRMKCLVGQIKNHPTIKDGSEVKILLIAGAVTIDGKIIKHEISKIQFELAEPEPGYLKWLQDTGIEYDAENPIKLVTELKYGGLVGKRPPDGGR